MKTLLKAEDVARLLQIKTKTVYKLASEGAIPRVKVGNAVRFDPDEIEKWMNTGGTNGYLGKDEVIDIHPYMAAGI